jgi:ABC-type hemin transport system substrate-binding protein
MSRELGVVANRSLEMTAAAAGLLSTRTITPTPAGSGRALLERDKLGTDRLGVSEPGGATPATRK